MKGITCSMKIIVTQQRNCFVESRLCNGFDEAREYSIELYRKHEAVPITWVCIDTDTGEELERGDASDFFEIEEFKQNQNL